MGRLAAKLDGLRRVCVLGGVLTAGCVSHVPLAGDYDGPSALPAVELETAWSQTDVVAIDDEELRNRPHFSVRRVVLPPVTQNRPAIEFEYYDPEMAGHQPVIVLLPIFNGQLIVTRYFARYFVNQGWPAIVVGRDRDLLDDVDDLDDALRANVADYRRVLDWVEEQPQLDASRIGLFGISFGAMDAVTLAALDPRVKALVAAMAGGDLPDVFLNTNYRPVARTVDDVLADTGLSRAGLRAQLETRIKTDPLRFAPYVDAGRVLMILARSDAIVPFESQEALRRKMGSPEALYLPTGHRTSVVFFPRIRAAAYEFFARQFAGEVADAKPEALPARAVP